MRPLDGPRREPQTARSGREHLRAAFSLVPEYLRGDSSTSEAIDYMDISPVQVVSTSAALIPFLEHDDANRALMGSNMQRQAVPLIQAEAPFVGTGMEETVARDSGAAISATRSGVVDQVDATRIVVRASGEVDAGNPGVDVFESAVEAISAEIASTSSSFMCSSTAAARVSTTPSYTPGSIGGSVSNVALKKICRRHGVPVPGRGHWAKKAAGKKTEPAPRLAAAEASGQGIEQREQAAFLLEQACELGQGYWFGRPVVAQQLDWNRAPLIG